MPAPGVVNDQPAHHVRGISHESRTVGEQWTVSRGHIKIRLVQERGGTETHGDAVSREFALGQPMEFGVQCREERL
jgi:hypothetical protein